MWHTVSWISLVYKKLIRRWDSERELSLPRHCTRTKNAIDSCINSATDRFLQRRFTKFIEIMQCNGHYAVQGHSRSPMLVHTCQQMASVPNGEEKVPKISIAWVGRTNVTDRQTDRRTDDDIIANMNLSSRSLKMMQTFSTSPEWCVLWNLKCS